MAKVIVYEYELMSISTKHAHEAWAWHPFEMII